jgi:hypothetical protein
MDPAWGIAAATLLAGWFLRTQNQKHHKEIIEVMRDQKTVYVLDAQQNAKSLEVKSEAEPQSPLFLPEVSESNSDFMPIVSVTTLEGKLTVDDGDLEELKSRRHAAAVRLRVWIRITVDRIPHNDLDEIAREIRRMLNRIIHEPFQFGSEIVGIAALSREQLSGATEIDLKLFLKSLYEAAGKMIMSDSGE